MRSRRSCSGPCVHRPLERQGFVGCQDSELLPQLTSPEKMAADAYEKRYILFARVLLALVVIHVGASARHHLRKRDGVVRGC
jgi:cytochrome b561